MKWAGCLDIPPTETFSTSAVSPVGSGGEQLGEEEYDSASNKLFSPCGSCGITPDTNDTIHGS